MHAGTPILFSGGKARHSTRDESLDSVFLLLKDAQASLPSDRNSACLYLTRVLTMLRHGETLPKTSLGRLSNWQIKRMLDYIDAHVAAPIRTVQLAAVLSLSVSHFTRVFKNTFGVTPLVYLARYRIESACRLMLTTNLSLTEIAYSHGFCDQSHFIRIFRRQTGITPHVWRRLSCADLNEEPGSCACTHNHGFNADVGNIL